MQETDEDSRSQTEGRAAPQSSERRPQSDVIQNRSADPGNISGTGIANNEQNTSRPETTRTSHQRSTGKGIARRLSHTRLEEEKAGLERNDVNNYLVRTT